MKEVLNPNDKPVINPFDSTPGIRYPPKNKIDDKVLRNTIAPYSAKKKNTKGKALSANIIDKVFIFIIPTSQLGLDYVINQSSNPTYWLWGYRVRIIVGVTHRLVVERSYDY